jgi:hypothetical protein
LNLESYKLNIKFLNQGSPTHKTIMYHISLSRVIGVQSHHMSYFSFKRFQYTKPSFIIFRNKGSSRHKTIIYHISHSRVIKTQNIIYHISCIIFHIQGFNETQSYRISYFAFKGHWGTKSSYFASYCQDLRPSIKLFECRVI